MAMAEARGRFLFELRPDWFPQGYATDAELELWGLYYEEKTANG